MNMLAYVNSYTLMDYMHVPTYVPVFVVVVRSCCLLVLFNIGTAVLGNGKALIASVAAVLYTDAVLFAPARGMECYVGGIAPVALALLTNSSVLWTQADSMLTIESVLLIDVCWAGACIGVMLLVSMSWRLSVAAVYCMLAVAAVLGVVHVLWLEGVYHTNITEFAMRILLFYTAVVMFYAVRAVVTDVCPQSHALMTLHCAMPVLWLQSVVLYLYCILCGAWIIYIVLQPSTAHSPDVMPARSSSGHLPACTEGYKDHADSHLQEVGRVAHRAYATYKDAHTVCQEAQKDVHTVAHKTAHKGAHKTDSDTAAVAGGLSDSDILLEQLRQAKMQQLQHQ